MKNITIFFTKPRGSVKTVLTSKSRFGIGTYEPGVCFKKSNLNGAKHPLKGYECMILVIFDDVQLPKPYWYPKTVTKTVAWIQRYRRNNPNQTLQSNPENVSKKM